MLHFYLHIYPAWESSSGTGFIMAAMEEITIVKIIVRIPEDIEDTTGR